MEKIPSSIGFILDGNRRWAVKNKLPKLEGHRKGLNLVKEVVDWAQEAGVAHCAFYMFSTENWNRSSEEVSYLMNLIKTTVDSYTEEANKKDIKIRVVGQRERFAPEIQNVFYRFERETSENAGITVYLCLSYGGRAEITAAVNKLIKEGLSEVTEQDIGDALWSAGMPDPDMIIRTSGEQRLSGFLTWRSVYSELFFTNTFWPDFSKEEFHAMLEEYGERHRRHGK